MSAAVYPFSAIIGHDQLRLALVLCAVRPDIGGVLIRGEKGTAKSTAVRALATILAEVDEGRLVELPIGATEDRVVGSLDLQKVLRDGEHAFSPGLLARAHRGVLYVDEVNLLHDHLVDVLLDAAAMGRVHIERDGISHSHDARFVLIGTMNPEEGELRPQLLDRFGLTVDVRASRDVDVRVQVIRARMDYESDPHAFAADMPTPTPRCPAGSPQPGAVVGGGVAGHRVTGSIAAVCAAFDVDGMRADLVVARTAVAHAAWRGPRPSTPTMCGWPRNWRCRTAAAAIRSTIRAWTLSASTRRMQSQAPESDADPDPDPELTRPAVAALPSPKGKPRLAIRFVVAARQSATPAGAAVVPDPRPAWCPGSGRAPGRRSRARNRAPAPRWGPPTPRRATGTDCTCSPPFWPPPAGSRRCGPAPRTCAPPSARAARAIW